jgi:hypothetical protein
LSDRSGDAHRRDGIAILSIDQTAHGRELELVKIGKRSSGITAASLHDMIGRNKASG